MSKTRDEHDALGYLEVSRETVARQRGDGAFNAYYNNKHWLPMNVSKPMPRALRDEDRGSVPDRSRNYPGSPQLQVLCITPTHWTLFLFLGLN